MSGTYRAGTATFTDGSDQVVGVGTLFVANVKAGDLIFPDLSNRQGIVESVEDDTHLTLLYAWTSTTVTAGPFTVVQTSHEWNPVTDLAATAAAIFAIINGPSWTGHPADTDNPHATTLIQSLTALGLTPAADKGLHLTGAGAAALHDSKAFGRSVVGSDGAIPFSASVNVASATIATDLPLALSNYIRVTGTTAITSLGTLPSGRRRWLRFAGALVLTHNVTSLILPGGANITTVTGDIFEFVSEGSGDWRCIGYARESGKSLVGPAAADISNSSAIGQSLLTAATGSDARAVLSLGSAALKDIVNPTDFTVTVAFATNGTFNPGGSLVQDGRYWKIGDFLFFWLSAAFNTNAYNAAVTGAFRVGGLPTVAALGPHAVTIGQTSMIKFDPNIFLSAQIPAGANYVQLYLNQSQATKVALGRTHIPPSVSGYQIELSGFYPV